MRPSPSHTDPRPSAPRAKGIRHRKFKLTAIKKEHVFAAMNSRYPATTLEPFLGTYRIVWDSESNYDPRDVLFADARPDHDRDPDDGLIVLARPQRAQAWPKEPTPASSVVLRFRDSFIGADRTASVLKPSPRPTPTPASQGPPSAASSSSSSLFSSPGPSPLSESAPSPLPSSASASTASLRLKRTPSSTSSTSASAHRDDDGARRFWRFDWDASFPRLGFRFEGMDLTGAHGHALSFARIRDDRGCPFAVLDLRTARSGAGSGAGRYITVLAKRVPDRYAREGLSDAERARLGMVDLDEFEFASGRGEGRAFDSE